MGICFYENRARRLDSAHPYLQALNSVASLKSGIAAAENASPGISQETARSMGLEGGPIGRCSYFPKEGKAKHYGTLRQTVIILNLT